MDMSFIQDKPLIAVKETDLSNGLLILKSDITDLKSVVDKSIMIASLTNCGVICEFNNVNILIDKNCTCELVVKAYRDFRLFNRTKEYLKKIDEKNPNEPIHFHSRFLSYPRVFADELINQPESGRKAKRIGVYLQKIIAQEYDRYITTVSNSTESGVLKKPMVDACIKHVEKQFGSEEMKGGIDILIATWERGKRLGELLGYKPYLIKTLREKAAYRENCLQTKTVRLKDTRSGNSR